MTPDDAQVSLGFEDIDRIVATLKNHGVEFMIIGGVAVNYHGYERTTKDLDIFIRMTQENAEKTVAALANAGFSWPDLTVRTFTEGKGILLGEAPLRVDIISEIDGVTFEEAWPLRKDDFYGSEVVPYIGLDELIRNKESAARPQDLVDAEKLKIAREMLVELERKRQNEKDEGLEL